VVHALRQLARQPLFAGVAILTLALGIGANAALYSVVQAVLLDPLPYHDPDRLVVVWENDRLRGTAQEAASGPDFEDWTRTSHSFERLVARTRVNRTLRIGDQRARIRSARVSTGFFATLGVVPLLGRDFVEEEGQPGRDRALLLGEGLWRSRFGADPGVVGRAVSLDGEAHTVVGVMPSSARQGVLIDQDAWEPLAFGADDRIRGRHSFVVLGRLRDGVSLDRAQTEMAGIMAQLESAYPDDNLGRGTTLVPLHEQIVGDVRPALLMLFGAVGLVLLIACANVAHLLLARGLARARELAIRRSLGASASRIARQLVTESLVLSLGGGAAGVLLALGGVRVLRAAGPTSLPRLAEVSVDARVLGVALLASLLTGVLFGWLPAWRAARRTPRCDLAEGARGSSARRAVGRQLLLVAEVALAVVLVVGAGLLIRSLDALQRVAPGYRSDGLLVAQLELKGPRYPFPRGWPVHDWPEHRAFTRTLAARMEAVPGLSSFALAQEAPTSSGWTTRVTVDGRPEVPEGEKEEAGFRPVGPDYFATLGVPIEEGRSFTRFDQSDAPLVAIVNRAFVRRHFPDGERPLGSRIRVFGDLREVVGIVGDIRFGGLASPAPPAMYLPLAQNPMPGLALVARAAGDPMALLPAIRKQLASVDPDLALFGITTAQGDLSRSLEQRRFDTFLLTLLAAVALTLSFVGVYGVISYNVAQRTREMGVRLALGARPRDVVVLVVGRGMGLVGAALLLGVAASVGATRALESLLFGVGRLDPPTLVAVTLLLAACAAVACYLPARRASRTDPLASLRAE